MANFTFRVLYLQHRYAFKHSLQDGPDPRTKLQVKGPCSPRSLPTPTGSKYLFPFAQPETLNPRAKPLTLHSETQNPALYTLNRTPILEPLTTSKSLSTPRVQRLGNSNPLCTTLIPPFQQSLFETQGPEASETPGAASLRLGPLVPARVQPKSHRRADPHSPWF